MKAMILAAGLGTRLKEITQNTPKCLVRAGSATMIEHTLAALRRAGVTQVIINTYYLADQVRAFLAGKRFDGIEVSFSHESELLGTGGGLLKAEDFFRDVDTFIVHNADVYSNIDLRQAVTHHCKRRALATLMVMSRQTNRPLIFGKDERLIGWRNGDVAEPEGILEVGGSNLFAFCGIQVLSREIFSFLSREKAPFSVITSYLNAAQQGALVQPYLVEDSYWIDVGTVEKLDDLSLYLARSGAN